MLDDLVLWGKTGGLSFNASKTAVMHFWRGNKTPHRKLSMEGNTLEYTESTKYLGVTLDRELKWRNHVENKIKSAKKMLCTLLAIT